MLVLDAGVIGVTSASYLAIQGFDVTVIDRQPGPALDASLANTGQVLPGYSAPWATPGIPVKAIPWLFQRHSPLFIQPPASLWPLQWVLQTLGNCTAERYALNKSRMVRLAEYSRECLQQLRASLEIGYEGGQGGNLQLFRNQKQCDAAGKDIAVLQRNASRPFASTIFG